MSSVIHIAGPAIIVDPGHMRQRCSWCGAVLIDQDLGRIAVAVPDGQAPTPRSWPVGALVEVGTGFSTIVEHNEGERLPASACAVLDPEVTR